MNKGSVVFLLGPTASGKTAASLQLAPHINAEIISVDSGLVYRGMDVGTAKPSNAERQIVPHHLIDICDPGIAYSAAQFCKDARQAIEDVRKRGALPLLSGGTMLYYHALENGLAPLPAADPNIRKSLAEQAKRVGWPALHAELMRVDPVAAARIHPNDAQRLQRALEVFRITGEPLSKLQQHSVSVLDTQPIKFALVPESRDWLHRRIAERFQAMLDAGFIEEVRRLREDTQLHAELPAMRSVGYRQAGEFLDGIIDRETFVLRALAATRQLAKRQLTWIRRMNNLTTIACDINSLDQQVDAMLSTLRH